MDEEITSIWLRVGGKGRKSVMIGGVYREHTIIGPWAPPNSSIPREQRRRWKQFLSQWKRAALRTSSCVVTGDTGTHLTEP